MSEMVSPLLQWLNANPEWAGVATFLISAGESVAIIGTIVPGSITMTAIGTLAGAGIIPLWATIFWAILGAIVGDGISYWMGYYFKDNIKNVWPFKTNPGVLSKGEHFVHRYGVMSVFIGRFVGPVRALVPLVAGMLGMKPLQFTIANVVSAIGWAPAYMLPGILLGAASLELPPDIAIHVIVVFFIISLFIILCFWTTYKLLLYVSQQLNQLQTQLWIRMHRSKILAPATILIRHYDANKTYGQFSLALLFLLSLTCLACLIFYVELAGAPNILFNDAAFHFFRGFSLKNESLDHIMIAITLFGQKQVILPVIATLTVWLLTIKRYRAALHIFLLGFLAAGGVFLLKHLLKVPRPWGLLEPFESYSFPSGHTTLAVTIYIGITLLIVHSLKAKQRLWFYLPPFLIAVAVSISRLYLGAHWFTDVLGAWLLSIAILSFVAISYQRQRENALNPWYLLSITAATLLITFSFYYASHLNDLKKHYLAQDWPRYEISAEKWWQVNGFLPAYQVSLFGFPSQRLNLEWAGDLKKIKATLLQQGWEKPRARDLISTIHRITDVSSSEYLPMVSWQYLDKQPALVLTKAVPAKKRMLVIRLWDANRYLSGDGQPLWVGTISMVTRTYSWVFKNQRDEVPVEEKLLFSSPHLLNDWEWKMISLSVPAHPRTTKLVLQKMMLVRPILNLNKQ